VKPVVETNELILVVDDSPETVGLLNEALEQAGMTSLVALEGSQAINIASRMMPDLILLDAVMPNMDGFEVCEKLKSDPELKNTPVIFMTGLKDTEHVVKGFEAGGVDYITKPINTQELIARMRVHLANARITMSAQAALDTAGQYVFAVNKVARILWSTPQVNQLLGANESVLTLDDAFSVQLRTWLSRNPSVGMGINLPGTKSLRVEFIAKSGSNEYLMRLIDNNKKDESAYLKEMLPVTGRESEVLFWIAKGKTNREIGQILGTSPRTVNKHLEQIFKKLGVENRTSAAAKAIALLKV